MTKDLETQIDHLAVGTRNPQEPKTCRAHGSLYSKDRANIRWILWICCRDSLLKNLKQKPLGEFEMPHHFKNIGEHVSMGNEDTHVFSGKEHDPVSGWQIKTYHYLFVFFSDSRNPMVRYAMCRIMSPRGSGLQSAKGGYWDHVRKLGCRQAWCLPDIPNGPMEIYKPT